MSHGDGNDTLDYIVVGAGIGGLAAAALLAKSGRRVLVLEAMGLPGGCAQTFRRGQYRFDAGATTIVGLEEHLPLGRLERALGIRFDVSAIDPAMVVWLNERRIERHTDREAWMGEAQRHFGDRQPDFWREVFRTSDLAWRLATHASRIPAVGLRDWVATIGDTFPDALRLLPNLVTSTERRARACGALPDSAFGRFLDEQLLITAQAPSDRVPFAVGAMGLSYTNLGNYTARGGVGALSVRLVDAIREHGGVVRYGHRVEEIELVGSTYRVRTRRGEHRARGVVSNLTIWDMADVSRGVLESHFRRVRNARREAWGAITLYLGVEDTFGDERALHHQAVFEDPIPHTGSCSVFVSLSPRGDAERAPEGRRAVTVSTHTACDPWWTMEPERYDDAKETVAEAILDRIRRFSGLGDLRVETRLVGTPRTFVRFTHRSRGRVGGIPTTFGTLVNATPSVTPFPSLYLVGDTVYPGQGIPAVVLGALNTVDRILGEA